ncbi:hypothetical protein SGRI78S_02676 [Streptomyces griseus subsp. griseus]
MPYEYRIREYVWNAPCPALTFCRRRSGTLDASTLPEPRAARLLAPSVTESTLSATTLKAFLPPLASWSTSSVRQEVLPVIPSVRSLPCPSEARGTLAFSWAAAKPPAAWVWAAVPFASRRPLRTCPMTTKPSSSTTTIDISRVPATTRS